MLERGKDEHRKAMAWLKKFLPDKHFMCLTVSLPQTYKRPVRTEGLIIMISNEEDFVLARLGLGFTDKELRGKNEDWAENHDIRSRHYLSRLWGVSVEDLMKVQAARQARKRARLNK